MADGSGDTGVARIVERDHTAVAQRELNLSLALLARHTPCYGAVYLVCQPVLAGHGFEREHVAEILRQVLGGIFRLLV